jgi:hypothetical protein
MEEKSTLMLKQENLELHRENAALKETVTKLLKEIDRVRQIDKTPNPNRVVLTVEQRIIEDQITYFEAISYTRALTLEETRAFDLLIKNKRLLDENKPIEADYTKVPDGKTESDLLRIAGNVEFKQSKKRNKSKTGSKDPVA